MSDEKVPEKVRAVGSGDILTDAGQVIVMNEEAQQTVMQVVSFGKGQCPTSETPQALTQRVEPPLDMAGLTTVLTDGLMAISGENALVSVPEIAERMAAGIGSGETPPRLQTTGESVKNRVLA